jgi:hypothetical protein
LGSRPLKERCPCEQDPELVAQEYETLLEDPSELEDLISEEEYAELTTEV